MLEPFLEKFERHLEESSMLKRGGSYYVACSGGPDSVTLFHLLLAIEKKWKLNLGLIHLNHNLRGSAATQDAAFVKRLAKKYHVPFVTEKLSKAALQEDPRLSVEEAARIARYDFFSRAAKEHNIKKILLAHTLDDQAETILMRVFQGTGLRGMMGIRQKIKIGGVLFLRPLLGFDKKEILSYAKEQHIRFCLDETNHQKRFRRNWLRLELIPLLEKKFNPRVQEAISRLPAILKEDNDLLEALEAAAWKQAFKSKRKGVLTLRRKALWDAHPSLQFRLLNRALREIHPQSGLSFEAWQRLRPNLGVKSYRCSLPRNIEFVLSHLFVKIYKN